jgi:hypothetical protein
MRTLRHFWSFCLIALAASLFTSLPIGMVTPATAQQSLIPVAETTGPTSAATCGVSSGNFARICRPGSNKRCLDAVKRGVKGFTRALCVDRREACETCLGRMQRCFRTKIDITTPATKLTTCKSCENRYNTCMKRIYPGFKG